MKKYWCLEDEVEDLNKNKKHLFDKDVRNKMVKIKKAVEKAKGIKEGDVIEYTNKLGAYYPNAIVDRVENGKIIICEDGNAYIGLTDEEDYGLSISGGSFPGVSSSDIRFKEKTERRVWTWGSHGACADGGLNFLIPVNKYICDLRNSEYSEKNYQRIFVSKLRNDEDYDYSVTEYRRGISNRELYLKEKGLIDYLESRKVSYMPHLEDYWRNEKIHFTFWGYKEKWVYVPEDIDLESSFFKDFDRDVRRQNLKDIQVRVKVDDISKETLIYWNHCEKYEIKDNQIVKRKGNQKFREEIKKALAGGQDEIKWL